MEKLYVLYWMQAAQRAANNPALEAAIARANTAGLPLLVLFCLDPDVPEANIRHYRFLLQGLWETAEAVRGRGARFAVAVGSMAEVLAHYIPYALEVVADAAVLRWQREARRNAQNTAREHQVKWSTINTEAVVPVEIASDKEEYSAATLRAKLVKLLPAWLEPIPAPDNVLNRNFIPIPALPANVGKVLEESAYSSLEAFIIEAERHLEADASTLTVPSLSGGYRAARLRLQSFIHEALPHYAQSSNDPGAGWVSGLSPYLHFGQISPLEVALAVLEACEVAPADLPTMLKSKAGLTGARANCAAFCEQLIVRRELAMNFCRYNPHYDEYRCLPAWARQTLESRLRDKRPAIYTPEALESAATADPYWNAAQREMLSNGMMHNYMRMYWGKKVIEWTPDPQTAFYLLQYLNNRYELDGRDPNGFAGIAWCFGKHDRPWQSRPVFGSVRYMNAAGLTRKFDMDRYLRQTTGTL